MDDPSKKYEILGFIFSEQIASINPDISSDFVKNLDNHDKIRLMLLEHLDDLSAALARFKTHPNYVAFIEFIKEALQWPSEQTDDTKGIVMEIIRSKYFTSVMLKTAEYILRLNF